MKWKVVVVNVKTGYNREASRGLKRKRAIEVALHVAEYRKGYTAIALPERLLLAITEDGKDERTQNIA